MLCGLNCCAKVNEGKVTEKFIDPDTLACGYCGHSGNADYWLEIEVQQVLNATGAKTLTEAMKIMMEEKHEIHNSPKDPAR